MSVIDFATRSRSALPDEDMVRHHDRAAWHLRSKRDVAAASVPDWQQLRDQAAATKAHVLAELPVLLEQFITNAQAAGWTVHCAADDAELRAIVSGILAKRGAQRVVKSKSMLTEECHLNDHLQDQGIQVVDTDLGERVVQLRDEPPSHIVIPAIHLRRGQIGDTFHEHLGTPAGEDDPERLTRAARVSLRQDLLAADAAITGVNVAVAETGGVVICTNEGNADLGASLPDCTISCMGVEKLVPGQADVATVIRLLARSATGQPITVYTSQLRGPDPTRPEHEAHLVILDNGRSQLLADEEHRSSLSCIRCGACMNTCPVFRRSGGHAYGLTVPGPIGSVLAPNMHGTDALQLPEASSLCGSCTHVCPVRIDLHSQLLSWRHRLVRQGGMKRGKRLAMALAARVLARPWLYRLGGWCARKSWGLVRRRWPGNPANPWLAERELPDAPLQSFRAWYAQRQRAEGSDRSGGAG